MRARHDASGSDLCCCGEFRQVARDRPVQVEATLLDKQHRGGRGDDGFGQRRDVVDRVFVRVVGFAVKLEFAKCVNGQLAVPSDRENPSGEGAICGGTIEQRISGAQAVHHRGGSRLQRHRMRGHGKSVAAPHRTGHCDGNLSGDGGLAEDGASRGALRHVVGREFREPGSSVREALDQVRIAERCDDQGLARGDQLVGEGELVVGKANAAFPIRDAHEKRGDSDIVGIGRRKRHMADRRILSVRAKNSERIDS